MNAYGGEAFWWWVVVIALGLALLYVSDGFGSTLIEVDHDHDDVRCFVRYAPEKVRDFSDLWYIKHRDDSKIVNYLMDDGNVIPERYESPDDARYWIERVYEQLRECSG